MVECQIVILKVMGSNPIIYPKIHNIISLKLNKNIYNSNNYIFLANREKINIFSKLKNFNFSNVVIVKISLTNLVFFFFNIFFFFNLLKFKQFKLFPSHRYVSILGFNLKFLNYKFFFLQQNNYLKASLKSFFFQQIKLQKNVENNYKSSKFLKLFFIFILKNNFDQFSKIIFYLKYYSFTFLFSFFSILKIISKFFLPQLLIWNFKKGGFKFYKKIKSIKKRLKKNNNKNFKIY